MYFIRGLTQFPFPRSSPDEPKPVMAAPPAQRPAAAAACTSRLHRTFLLERFPFSTQLLPVQVWFGVMRFLFFRFENNMREVEGQELGSWVSDTLSSCSLCLQPSAAGPPRRPLPSALPGQQSLSWLLSLNRWARTRLL